MMYPFMTLEDETEVTHSEVRYDENGNEFVRVNFEKPVIDGFHSAWCTLPGYKWSEIEGFSEPEIKELQEYLETVATLIIKFARKGGFGHAADF